VAKILFFNWKDIAHPKAGGAEVVTHAIAKKLAKNDHKVTLITAKYPNSKKNDQIDGVKIIRLGNLVTHYPLAIWYYLRNLRNKFEIIIEEVNTIPYFVNFFKGKEKLTLYYNMLAREIWFYEFFQPLSIVGFWLEPVYTWFQSRFNNTVLTISESSKQDLIKYGFKSKNIQIFSMWPDNTPLEFLRKSLPKEESFTVLYHGSLRKMKRPLEAFKAFKYFLQKFKQQNSLANKKQPQLWISGGGSQTHLKEYAKQNNFLENVTFFGRTTEKQKLELMQKTTVLAVTSLKEGWGLIVTEANSMGTPAVVYDVDGLRDSASFEGNFAVKEEAKELGKKLFEMYDIWKSNPNQYNFWREKVLQASKKINFERAYQEFCEIINLTD